MNKENFWYKDEDAGKCSESDLIEFEKKNKIKLPDELRELYKVQNGGGIQSAYFRDEISENTYKNYSYNILVDFIFGIDIPNSTTRPLMPLTDELSYYDEDVIEEFSENYGKPELFFLFHGDGHYYYALDYNNGNIPRVVYIEIECGLEVTQAYTNFSSFLKSRYTGEKLPFSQISKLDVKEELRRWEYKIKQKGNNMPDIELKGIHFLDSKNKENIYVSQIWNSRKEEKLFCLEEKLNIDNLTYFQRSYQPDVIQINIKQNCIIYSSSKLDKEDLWLNEIEDKFSASFELHIEDEWVNLNKK